MTTMRDSINETRRLVYGSMSEQVNLLSENYYAGTDVLVMQLDVTGITPGMVLSSGLNVWWVKEVAAATKTVYVIPSWEGSYNDDVPVNSVVMIRPRATDWFLFNEVNRAIMQMSSRTKGLYRVGHETARSEFGKWGVFSVSPAAESILAIRVSPSWQQSGTVQLQDRDWRWNSRTGEIRILNPSYSWVNEISVMFRGAFSPAVALDIDLAAQCGMAPSMEDIPALGAAANLLLTTEGRRGQLSAQSDPRKAAEVVAGSNASAAREMRRQYDARIDDEYIRLVNANPYKISI